MCESTSRRDFLAASLAASLTTTAGLAGCAGAAPADKAALGRAGRPGERVLLKGGVVLSLDPAVGDFERADVLIEGDRIAAVAPNLHAPTATVLDASNRIVMPGFVDTHRHIWQAPLRNILPDGTLGEYLKSINTTARDAYRPEDAYVGGLLTAWGAMNAGITTLLDWSHVSNSPAHSDAAIRGLLDSGIRAVYAYGGGNPRSTRFPQDIQRLRQTYFSSADQRVSLAMATGINAAHWKVAREAGAPVTLHANGTGQLLPVAAELGPDITYIHCCNLNAEEWKRIADTGGTVSLAAPVEMQMGHGLPPIQQVLDLKIPFGLSNDVETSVSADLFFQMRTVFVLQRMQLLARGRAGEKNLPPLMKVKQLLEVATLGGARVNHLERRTGSLTPGKQADVLMLATDRVNVMPLNNAYGAVAQGMDSSNVDTVFVAGEVKKLAGELVGVDVKKLLAQAEASRDYLRAQAGWPSSRLGGYAPGH